MNALTVAWKLRVDMLGILAAASPRSSERGSEARRRAAKVEQVSCPQTQIQDLLSQNSADGMDDAGGHTASSELGCAADLAAELDETGVMPASQRRPDIVLERQHA